MISQSYAKEFSDLISDNTSGSLELLEKLFRFLSHNQKQIDLDLILHLQNHFSEFQTINSFLSEFRKAFDTNSIQKFFMENKFPNDKIFVRIFKNFEPVIQNFNSFLTISNSKTILKVIKLVANERKKLQIFVSEGRPNFEGRILAEKLVDKNISTTLITEAQIYQIAQKCDCAIIGADKVLENGNVINKVGSNLIAISCSELGKPFYVLANKTKFSKNSLVDNNEKSRKEIYSGMKNEIKIDNYYFEEIDKELITKIITD